MDADPLKLKSRAFAFECLTSTPEHSTRDACGPWNAAGSSLPATMDGQSRAFAAASARFLAVGRASRSPWRHFELLWRATKAGPREEALASRRRAARSELFNALTHEMWVAVLGWDALWASAQLEEWASAWE